MDQRNVELIPMAGSPSAWKWLSWMNWHFSISSAYSTTRNGILNYHSVSPVDSGLPCEVSTERFERDMRYLVDNFEIVDLPELLENRTSGKKQIAITFDDGFENFYSNALPVLREFDVKATVFVNPSFIGDSNKEQIMSNHALNRAPSPIMMDQSQLRELSDSKLVRIGNHTLTHEDLSTIDSRDVMEKEIIGAKHELEEEYGITVNRFAYPYGQFNKLALDVVQESHTYGVGTSWSLLTNRSKQHTLPRIGAHTPERMVRWELTDLSHRIRVGTDRISF